MPIHTQTISLCIFKPHPATLPYTPAARRAPPCHYEETSPAANLIGMSVLSDAEIGVVVTWLSRRTVRAGIDHVTGLMAMVAGDGTSGAARRPLELTAAAGRGDATAAAAVSLVLTAGQLLLDGLLDVDGHLLTGQRVNHGGDVDDLGVRVHGQVKGRAVQWPQVKLSQYYILGNRII